MSWNFTTWKLKSCPSVLAIWSNEFLSLPTLPTVSYSLLFSLSFSLSLSLSLSLSFLIHLLNLLGCAVNTITASHMQLFTFASKLTEIR
jgi:hypothetical protein